MQGLIGWLKSAGAGPDPMPAMLSGCGAEGVIPNHQRLADGWGVAAWSNRADMAQAEGITVAIVGRPRVGALDAETSRPAHDFLALWLSHGPAAMEQLWGTFALAVVDSGDPSVYLAVDRMGVENLALSAGTDAVVFAHRADAVAAHPEVGRALDPQELFNYLYFHDVPAPGTIFQGVEKLLPGQWLQWRPEGIRRGFYWHLRYRDRPRHDFEAQSARFHQLLRECVARARGGDDVAAFLSGGTDSSTVCGILAEHLGGPPRTYSIGFPAQGFDEMEYARLAARHFGLDAREYYLEPDDVLAAIPVIAGHYDEPFANDSAVPTLFCARMAAADGYKVMLAGDGGDEIFGGNARYAKQKVFEAYHHLPAGLRRGLVEPLANLPGLSALPPVRKLQSYIRQANIPLPDRMESYNFIYRQPLEEMFTPDLLDAVDVHQPSVLLKDAYDRADSGSVINRMLHLDLKFTLADNDLRKVSGMAAAAGIEVRYPLLDDAMVMFSGEVPPDWKVKGQYLRWFFKTALKGFLPNAIIDKSKHGFGLPFGVWARDHPPLRQRVEDRLSDFSRRGYLAPAFIEHLRTELMTGHATYFRTMIWVMVILEEWLARRGL